MDNDILQVSIWRGGAEGGYQVYHVPARASQTVLDVVTHVQRHIDETLSYRFACRVGMCGSCAMMVNGVPRWTCRSHVSLFAKGGKLQLAPLANLPVIKDLAVDMTTFFEKWQNAEGKFHTGKTRNDADEKVSPQTPQRKAADAAIECINCSACYAACDTVKWNKNYFGPAALNRAWTLVNDDRDTGTALRQEALASSSGCFNCHSHQSCQAVCPVGLNPAASIAGLKRAVLRGSR